MIIHRVYNKLQFRFLFLLLSLLTFFIPIQTGFASEFKFHIKPILPESQIAGNQGYFNLNLEPGAKETLGLTLINESTETLPIQVTAHTAYTHVNGEVVYGKDAEEPDPTLKYSLGDLLETPDVVNLAPGETQDVFFSLTMPQEYFNGLLAGGLRIQAVADVGEKSAGVELSTNSLDYEIGVIVSNSRSPVTPDLALLEVFASQLNGRNTFSATIQNYLPTFVNQLEVEAQIRMAGSEEVLYEAQISGMQMAPNSHFHFPISLNGDRFRSGEYVLTMKARSGSYEWSWDEVFTVDYEIARRLNREDVTLNHSLDPLIIGSVGLVFLLILMIGYLIYQQQKLNRRLDH